MIFGSPHLMGTTEYCCLYINILLYNVKGRVEEMFELKDVLKQIGTRMVKSAFNELPSSVKINLDPIKDYILESKKPSSNDVVQVTGKRYRKQVMVFEDQSKNYNQY